MSGATAWKPAAASASIWWRQEYQDSGKPWHNSTSGPLPCSAMLRRMPLVSIIRCVGSLMFIFAPSGAHHGETPPASNAVENNNRRRGRQLVPRDSQRALGSHIDFELLADLAHELVERGHEAMHRQHHGGA